VLVLLGVFSLIMWVLLKPFRRLTSMAPASKNAFGEAASLGHPGRAVKKVAGQVISATAAGATAGVGGAAAWAQSKLKDRKRSEEVTDEEPLADPRTERAEAKTVADVPALPAPQASAASSTTRPTPGLGTRRPDDTGSRRFRRAATASPRPEPAGTRGGDQTAESRSLPVVEPERIGGEEVYPIYRPITARDADDVDGVDLAGRSA
jgi:hypothetical protein